METLKIHNFKLLGCFAMLMVACQQYDPGDSSQATGAMTSVDGSTGISSVTGGSFLTTTSGPDITTTSSDTIDSTSSENTVSASTSENTETTSVIGVCGDGVVGGKEECDDGNDVDHDDCKNNCKLPTCGDGVIHKGVEECDDGNVDSTDDCTVVCKNAKCGDGYVYKNIEECDDSDKDNTDECTSTCKLASCGDGFIYKGIEVCDDGVNDNSYGSCTSDCKKLGPHCGDGIHDFMDGEFCDTSDPFIGIGCTGLCAYNFGNVPQFYCHGTCSWAGPDGCDQADADIFCKLRTGNPSAKATSFEMTSPKANLGGFGCGNPNKFVNDGMGNEIRKNLGNLPDYGVDQPVFYVEKSLLPTHAGNTITKVTCSGG